MTRKKIIRKGCPKVSEAPEAPEHTGFLEGQEKVPVISTEVVIRADSWLTTHKR